MMKHVLLALTVILITQFNPLKGNDMNSKDKSDLKTVIVVYSEKGTKVDGKEILMVYYDEETLSKVILKDTTNSDGAAIYSVPGNDLKASCIFTFAFTEKGINKCIAMRIPAESNYGGQDSITINIGKGKMWYIQNSEAPIQWMNFPNDGSKVEEIKSDINILKYDWGTQNASDIKKMSFVNGGYKGIGVGDIFMPGSCIFVTLK
jgi:hypothetical protein